MRVVIALSSRSPRSVMLMLLLRHSDLWHQQRDFTIRTYHCLSGSSNVTPSGSQDWSDLRVGT